VSVCVWLWGGSWWVVVVWVWAGGCVWCVCVVLGWWVRSPRRLLLLLHKAARAAGRRPRKFWFIFAVKHDEKAIHKSYTSAISNYIRLYPTISHHIPSYIISHHIPRTISHHIPPHPTISKQGYPKDIRQRGAHTHR